MTRDYGYGSRTSCASASRSKVFRLHRLRDLRVRVVVVGAGSWGTAVACLLRDNGHEVTLAARDPEQVETINGTGRIRATPRTHADGIARRRSTSLPSRTPSSSWSRYRAGCSARSSHGSTATRRSSASRRASTPRRASGSRLWCATARRRLSGRHRRRDRPRAPGRAVVASDDLELAVRVQVAVHSILLRVYVSDDVAGVELCAAAKNVIALAAGGADVSRWATTRRPRSSRVVSRR